jgi:stage III sporulation protein SpoIIIAA
MMIFSGVKVTDNLDQLLVLLPQKFSEVLCRQPDIQEILELVFDLGRPPEAFFIRRVLFLNQENVTQEDIDYIAGRVGDFTSDNRAGIERTLHRISAMRNRRGKIIGLTCRIGRAIFGTIDIIKDIIESGKNILLMGPPGIGKTTKLREIARVLSDDFHKRVVVVDTSNEIAGDGDVPHPGIGSARRMQVPAPNRQHAVMIEAVENHMPEVIIVDEIGTELESAAARTIAERGVQLVGIAHGNNLENLLMNPILSDLVGGVQSVILSDEEAKRRRTQKAILERKAPPTFDILIEIRQRDEMAIYRNVAEAVDLILLSKQPAVEIRKRLPDGQFEIQAGSEAAEETFVREVEKLAGGISKGKKVGRIFLFGINRSVLKRAVKTLGLEIEPADTLDEADVVLTTRTYDKPNSKIIRSAESRRLPVHILKNNSFNQVIRFLKSFFGKTVEAPDEEMAINEVNEAIKQVLLGKKPVEVSPANAYLRRLQHQIAGEHALHSESIGEEPFRRIVVYPPEEA